MNRSLALLALAGVLCAALASSKSSPSYRVETQVKLGGDGGWDYLSVDSAAHRLYISRGTHVMVVDTDSDKVVGDVPNTAGVHRAVIDTKDGIGYTSNGRDNTATEFDPKTLKAIKSIPVGTRPDAIIYDGFSNQVFTFNGGSQNATAINASTGEVAGTVALDGRPEFATTDNAGNVFCNIEDKSEIQQIDPKSLKVVNTWSLAPGDGPSGLDIDPADHVLFSVCDNKMMVVLDYSTGKVVATPAIGQGPDAAGFDPGPGYAFSSNGEDGTLTVVGKDDSGKWTALQTLPTKASARTLAVDPSTHKIYLVGADFEAAPPSDAGGGRRRRPMAPGSFTLIVVSPSS